MRRLLRWSFNLTVIGCGLLLLAVAAAWAASWHAVPRADVTFYDAWLRLSVARGSLFAAVEEAGDMDGGIITQAMEKSDVQLSVAAALDPGDDAPPAADRVLGFGLTSEPRAADPQSNSQQSNFPQSSSRSRAYHAVAPAWAAAGLLSALPAVRLGRWSARRRRNRSRERGHAPRGPSAAFAARASRSATVASAVLLVASAATWAQALRWHDYRLQWEHVPPGASPKRGLYCSLRADALQGAAVFSVDRPELPDLPDLPGGNSLSWYRSWRRPEWREEEPPEPHPLPWFAESDLYTRPIPDPSRADLFAGGAAIRSPRRTGREWQVPYWFLILVNAPLPALGLARWVRAKRRVGAGLCPRCGYDLRATPNRCPECGTVPAGKAAP